MSVFSISVVPTGLAFRSMQNPGTEVPGYFRRVPMGRKVTEIPSIPGRKTIVS